jgi:hypothetical protein
MFTINELIDLGVEFDIHLDNSCVPVWLSINHDAKILKHADWKKIKVWLQSDELQKYLFPRLFVPMASRPKKGQLEIFDA